LTSNVRNDGTWCKSRLQDSLSLLVAPTTPTLRPHQQCYLSHAALLRVLIRTSLRAQTHNQASINTRRPPAEGYVSIGVGMVILSVRSRDGRQ
jgi:hypothetical protein